MSGRVAIIVLNWNRLRDTIECLESLQRITYPDYEVIVVDNGSDGDDADVLEEKFGDYMHLIRNDTNLGYTGGNNTGMRYALEKSAPDYFLLLNNDTTVAPDFLERMVEVAEGDERIGLVGPKVYYHGFPDRIYSAGGRVSIRTGRAWHIGMKEVDRGQYDVGREVDYVPGCCLLVKTQVVGKVGLLDESYFCYWEETDYCFRARKAGYRSVYAPEARIWHKAPLKLSVWDRAPAGGTVSGLYRYYMARNSFKFLLKHATKGQYRTFLLYMFGCHVWFMTGVCLLYHRDPGQLRAFWRGVGEGWGSRG